MDTYYLIICISIAASIIAVLLLFFLDPKQRTARVKKKYADMLANYNAQCTILCNYLQGIDYIKDNTPCTLYAGNNNITIITKEKPPKAINLNLAKVRTFHKFNRDKIVPYMDGLTLLNLQSYSEFIIIKCLSDNLSEQEIFFTLDISDKQKTKNDYYLSQCNIFDFINAIISKQDTSVEL